MRIWVTDYVHEVLLKGLRDAGNEVDYEPKIALQEVRNRISVYDGIIINSKITADKMLIDAAPKLRFIGRLGSGLDIIDLDHAKGKNIAVISVPEGNRQAVAEHAIGMLLCLWRKLLSADNTVRTGQWHRERHRGTELRGKTVGIIGFGNTGSSFARVLSGFGCNILAYDKYLTEYAGDYPYVAVSNVNRLLHSADIISFHIPLTSETYHYADARFFEQCKTGAVIINTSRGKVVKLKDLLQSLESGKLSGACLDVFENEKPAAYSSSERKLYDELFKRDNVVLSPHIAGWTHESKYLIGKYMLEKILDINQT